MYFPAHSSLERYIWIFQSFEHTLIHLINSRHGKVTPVPVLYCGAGHEAGDVWWLTQHHASPHTQPLTTPYSTWLYLSIAHKASIVYKGLLVSLSYPFLKIHVPKTNIIQCVGFFNLIFRTVPMLTSTVPPTLRQPTPRSRLSILNPHWSYSFPCYNTRTLPNLC